MDSWRQKKIERRRAEENKWARIGAIPTLILGLFGIIIVISLLKNMDWSVWLMLGIAGWIFLLGLRGVIQGKPKGTRYWDNVSDFVERQSEEQRNNPAR